MKNCQEMGEFSKIKQGSPRDYSSGPQWWQLQLGGSSANLDKDFHINEISIVSVVAAGVCVFVWGSCNRALMKPQLVMRRFIRDNAANCLALGIKGKLFRLDMNKMWVIKSKAERGGEALAGSYLGNHPCNIIKSMDSIIAWVLGCCFFGMSMG